jgi:hypothetical protein
MSLAQYQRITQQAAEELRRAAERFETMAEEADRKLREVLEKWEREMNEKSNEQ